MGIYVRSENRLLLIKAGPLSAVLAQRLLSATVGNRCVVNDAFKLGAAILSQSHKFDEAPLTCVATVAGVHGHRRFVSSVAFHPSAHTLATGGDKSAKLWRLSLDDFSVTHVATLKGHRGNVNCVAFHPTASLLATGSDDHTAKLWRLSSDNTSATCVATTKGHSSLVVSVAFHPTAHMLATGNCFAKTATLWR